MTGGPRSFGRQLEVPPVVEPVVYFEVVTRQRRDRARCVDASQLLLNHWGSHLNQLHSGRMADANDVAQQMAELEQFSEALHWIRATFLQIERFVEVFLDFAESETKDATQVTADGHFLLNACAQTEKALRRSGIEVSSDRRTTIRSLRDVHEHWEQHKKSFESKRASKTKSGQRFNEAHPHNVP